MTGWDALQNGRGSPSSGGRPGRSGGPPHLGRDVENDPLGADEGAFSEDHRKDESRGNDPPHVLPLPSARCPFLHDRRPFPVCSGKTLSGPRGTKSARCGDKKEESLYRWPGSGKSPDATPRVRGGKRCGGPGSAPRRFTRSSCCGSCCDRFPYNFWSRVYRPPIRWNSGKCRSPALPSWSCPIL